MRSNKQLRGRPRISAGGNRGPTRQDFEDYFREDVSHREVLRTILSPRDKVLIILAAPKEITFREILKKYYGRLERAGFEFYFLDGVSKIPHKVQQIINEANSKKEMHRRTQANPTGWEAHRTGPNF